jgi:hypothetical protein
VRLEIEAALSRCRATRAPAGEPLTPEQAEDLLLLDGFIRRPPPELAVLPLDAERIASRVSGRSARALPTRSSTRAYSRGYI